MNLDLRIRTLSVETGSDFLFVSGGEPCFRILHIKKPNYFAGQTVGIKLDDTVCC